MHHKIEFFLASLTIVSESFQIDSDSSRVGTWDRQTLYKSQHQASDDSANWARESNATQLSREWSNASSDDTGSLWPSAPTAAPKPVKSMLPPDEEDEDDDAVSNLPKSGRQQFGRAKRRATELERVLSRRFMQVSTEGTNDSKSAGPDHSKLDATSKNAHTTGTVLPNDPNLWTSADVIRWLAANALDNCAPAFASRGLDGPRLLALTSDLLATMKIDKASRLVILRHLVNLRQAASQATSQSVSSQPTSVPKSKFGSKFASYSKKTGLRPPPADVNAWTVTDVKNWLESEGLSRYVSPFLTYEVDGVGLARVKESDLASMDIEVRYMVNFL
jgi:hypothetical protein